MIGCWLLFSLMECWLPAPTPSIPSGQVYAVVVGIADYRALTFFSGDLRYADADARRMARFLQSRAGGSVAASNLRLLVNSQATKQNIINALALFRKAKPGDKVIFYFSGHGVPNSFVPYDVEPGSGNLDEQLLTHDLLKQVFRASAASTKLCVADACYAGSMTARKIPDDSGQPTANKTNTGTNTALILAARSNQQAVETGQVQGGIFTYFLLRGLQGRADTNGDRVVTIRELYAYVTPLMRQIMPRNATGQLVSNRVQAPLFYGNFSDDLPIAKF